MEKFMEKKKSIQRQFIKDHGLDQSKPVISIRSRFDAQKGMELLFKILPQILSRAVVIIVTWCIESASEEMKAQYKKTIELSQKEASSLLINPACLSHVEQTKGHYRISDFFLMSSKYEPCGLGQMECQQFSVIPIVRKTGGLSDTVSETMTSRFPSPNGFVFSELNENDLISAIDRAVTAFYQPETKKKLIEHCLNQNNAWDERVPYYEKFYGI